MVSQQQTNEARLRILKAAETEFAEKGFDGARVDGIAQRAGVNKALLYYYFKSKAGLLDALFDDFFLQLKSERRQIPRPDDPTLLDDYWKAVIRHLFSVTRSRLELMRVALLEELKGGPGHDRVVRRWRTEWEATFSVPGAGIPRQDQAIFNFFFEDLNMIMFLLMNEKWSHAMGRSAQESEESFFHLVRVQSDAYWNRAAGESGTGAVSV